MAIAIIPARGGSKRIPRKNIKPFHGKPMICWSIEAALASDCFDQVVVSTDDAEIAAVAESAGAVVPFIRQAALADDYATTTAVIVDAIRRLELAGKSAEHYCCIYATAPFLSAQAIIDAHRHIRSGDIDFVFSATSYAFPIQRAFKLGLQGGVQMFYPEHRSTRSQDLDEAYHDAGQFYWGSKAAWLEQRTIFGEASEAFVLPRHQVLDIDTPEDWQYAELMHRASFYQNQ